ncbi:MAG TPA: chromosome segregation protein SMC [Clostridiaceae bacterium]|nr:chromosome segregation protein SMC [Clostridiaceae bacterium]
MYLKKLEIQGFKSFADKITLEFDSGITSVVGPNGSGKSNIADAIRWVLGEQSIKTLRGSKMEDVIFAGTEHRRPLGFAEVSITFDNSSGKLPIEYSEVTVTRRVFRSGESEYMINKTPCRLKDIYQLFFDTGIGREGYSVIGQGRIDEILSTKSEDRRGVFEEASGIMKYKTRKLEAEKKLELTKQNLLRINDIINELENQLEPLKVQSEIARKYLRLKEELKELEINVCLNNIDKLREKLKDIEKLYTEAKENVDTETNRLETITTENSKKTELLKAYDERLNALREEYYNIEGNLERCQSEIRINEEKISSLKQNIDRIDNEVKELELKQVELAKDKQSRQGKLEYLNKQYEVYSNKLSDYEKQLEEVMASLSESERYIEKLKITVMDKLDLLSDKKTQINSIKSHIEGIEKRQKSIDNELFQISLESDREKLKKEELTASIQSFRESLIRIKADIEKNKKSKEELEAKLDGYRKKQNGLKTAFQVKNSRHKMLKEMERNLEGYNRTVKEFLHACDNSPELSAGIHGALAQLIEVDKKFVTAIEMSLGSALQNIVTDREEDAKKAIEFLKSRNLGRATFLPISAVKGKSIDQNTLDRIRNSEGYCGVASDLVKCEEKYRQIILNLLGRVIVVDNMDSAIKMSRKFNYSFRVVTLDGDIFNTGGSITGGSREGRNISLLSRSREIQELEEQIQKILQDESLLEKEINELIEKITVIDEEITRMETEYKNSELSLIRDESHLAQINDNISKYAARMDMLRQEKEQLSRQKKETEREQEKYKAELVQIENEIEETKRIIAEHQEKQKENQTVRDSLYNDITGFKISVNSILESLNSVRESLDKIESESAALGKSIKRKETEKSKNAEEMNSIMEKNEGIKQTIKKQQQEKDGKTFELDRISEEKKVLEEEIYDIVNKINEINKNILLMQEELSRLEIRKSKVESDIEAIQNKMWDEYELTYTNALPLRKDIGAMSSAQKRIDELKSQIRELGNVNVSSIDEYIKTKERYEFMTAQRDDMEQAKEKLRRMISEITSVMKKQFIEQFELINKNFDIVFKELFDGGRASLKLTDEENVLESGIEIHVQPPGKKLQNMALLSGGERAFTAIALLFAILRLRPSPFCVLDEIEAALDDANVSRFAEYLHKLSSSTQFIVITHRKGTMEASDMLYGVTMQERGISKIVSMNLKQDKAV